MNRFTQILSGKSVRESIYAPSFIYDLSTNELHDLEGEEHNIWIDDHHDELGRTEDLVRIRLWDMTTLAFVIDTSTNNKILHKLQDAFYELPNSVVESSKSISINDPNTGVTISRSEFLNAKSTRDLGFKYDE